MVDDVPHVLADRFVGVFSVPPLTFAVTDVTLVELQPATLLWFGHSATSKVQLPFVAPSVSQGSPSAHFTILFFETSQMSFTSSSM